jgi:hypothetical protein
MDFDLQNIEDYTRDLAWMLKALEQVEKEFQIENWTLKKPINPDTAYAEIIEQVHPLLNELLLEKGSAYCNQLLYKIDISERQIAKAVARKVDVSFSEMLSELIVRRCLQKVLIRNYYKSPEKDASGNSLEE